MTDEQILKAMAEMLKPVNDRLALIDNRLNSIDERLTNLEEDSKITRASVNTLLEWAEDAQVQVKIPLFKKAE